LSRPEERCWTNAPNPQELAQHCFVAVISGGISKTCGLVDLDDLYYASSHGFDIAGPKGSTWIPVGKAVSVAWTSEKSLRTVWRTRGQVERKSFPSRYYRRVAEGKIQEVEIGEPGQAESGQLRQTSGKRKSLSSARYRLAQSKPCLAAGTTGLNRRCCLYLEDDVTDEAPSRC
jgi:trehalose-6-phosphatase